MSKRSDLAGSLATVAIAALGGPLMVARTALTEVVKRAKTLYDEKEESRQIVEQVAGAVSRWAASNKLADDDVNRGLELARDTVWSFGISTDVLAQLRFEAAAAAEAVVAAATEKDPRWGTEDHYTVAIRAIVVTYEALIAQLRAHDGTAIALFLTLHRSIQDYAAGAEDKLEAIAASSDVLSNALTGSATVADVMSYLKARIGDWDVSVWHPGWKASSVEQILSVREQNSELSAEGQLLGAQDALASEQTLVVLGDPGAGKTWLARRYARQAAQAALSQLENGARVDEVELPLLTTWEQWLISAGDTDQSLVASSFASGLGHSNAGDAGVSARLKRTFLGSAVRVLLVVDSLDEAADKFAQGPRVRELLSLPSRWRIVVTSRPAAWSGAYPGGMGSRKPQVVELHDLSYPDEVETFVRDWFREAKKPGRGETLIQEIRKRPELARAAVVPLMLTFYCLLADAREGMTPLLPSRRRELFHSLVLRLLRGAWTTNPPGPDSAPDRDYCEKLLRSWAWSAVRGCTNAAGLGVWADSFTQPGPVQQQERRAIDHIVPKAAEDDEGTVTRRFVHRTFLEHFVAEHVAGLDANCAAELLLPHLWFDPDWEVAAPAAIVAHNQQQKGALLHELMSRALPPAKDPARQMAHMELEVLLLGLAQESEPNEWTHEHQELLHRCRVDNAVGRPDLVARSANWTSSNPNVRAALLRALKAAKEPRDVCTYVEVLRVLEPTDGEWVQVRMAVLDALTVADEPSGVRALAEVLLSLATTADERRQARTAVSDSGSAADEPWGVRALAEVLLSLAMTADERTQVRTAVLKALPRPHSQRHLYYLAGALPTMEPTASERAQARTGVLEALAAAEEPLYVHGLLGILRALAITAGERAQTRGVVLKALAAAKEPWRIRDLAELLLSLEPSAGARMQVRTVVLKALASVQDPGYVPALAEVLLSLEPSEDERAEARSAVLKALAETEDPGYVPDLAAVLPALAPMDSERAEARSAVLKALADSDNPGYVPDIATVLPALATTAGERAEGRTALLKALTAVRDPGQIHGFVEVLRSLATTDGERADVRTAALEALAVTTEPWRIRDLTELLLSLEPDGGERVRVRTALLAALAAAKEPWPIRFLSKLLLPLEPTEDERVRVRKAVLEALARPHNAWDLRAFAWVLLSLATTEDERAQIRPAVLKAVADAKDPGYVPALAGVLPYLPITEDERAQVRNAALKALADAEAPWYVPDLAGALLSLSVTEDERAQVRNAVLKLLADTKNPRYVPDLAGVLLSLPVTDDDRTQVRKVVLRALTDIDDQRGAQVLGKVLRSFSLPEEWMAWLTVNK